MLPFAFDHAPLPIPVRRKTGIRENLGRHCMNVSVLCNAALPLFRPWRELSLTPTGGRGACAGSEIAVTAPGNKQIEARIVADEFSPNRPDIATRLHILAKIAQGRALGSKNDGQAVAIPKMFGTRLAEPVARSEI
ncbi:hypothetical protein I5535_10900 [Rhodobacteraceae bacterium F11138]|nr:hypothetical protein [Rhodobacteraceae bacterium F11138]